MKKERNIALIMAGGSGDRMGTDTPKQFVCLGGVPVILYTLKAFQEHPEIDEIGVVCVPGWEDFVRELAQKHGIDKLKHIFVGKKSSHESVRTGMEGLCEVCDMKDIVLVHDAVRPFISAQIITDNIEVCRTKGNAITAVLDNEALMYSTDGVASEKYFPREVMYKAQTPHTFRLEDLKEVYEEADRKGICAQSLYTLMAELKRYPLYIAKGHRLNMKLTVPDDILVFEAILSIKTKL